MFYNLFYIINKLELVIEILLGLRFVISWLAPNVRNSLTDLIYSLTEPLLRPFRAILSFGNFGIDLSPIILIFVIRMLKSILFKIIILFVY
ncbi:YggT family protein [Fusobacterium russii]|uniref:YggT family protein n=1 Tax=Fusobacterium russii TaxID=854 RepID=UPI0003A5BE24|nr:YggT family protein [Fusobacterium russii]